MAVEFKSVDKGQSAMQKRLAMLRKKGVLVGIPSSADRPVDEDGKPTGITMAGLALIHEKGLDSLGIPARPFMAETKKKYGPDTLKYMASLYKRVIKSLDPVKAAKLLGIYYSGRMQEIFTTGSFAPNSKITVEGGWMRNKISGRPFRVKPKRSTRPLIDNGHLRNSIKSKVVDL